LTVIQTLYIIHYHIDKRASYFAGDEAAKTEVDVFGISHTEQGETCLNCTEYINVSC